MQTFRQAWHQKHHEAPTRVGAWRAILIGADPQDALARGERSGQLTFSRYREGEMQEQHTVGMRLTLGDDATEWAILGNYQDCLEAVNG